MIQFDVTMPNGAQLGAKLDTLAKQLDDFRPLWDLLEENFYETAGYLFDSEGASGEHGKWAPLSPRYAAYKAAKWPGRKILERTGLLRESLTKRGAAGQFLTQDQGTMIIGTTVKYAAAHQFAKKRPIRRPIDPSKNDVERWAMIAEMWLGDIAGETFA